MVFVVKFQMKQTVKIQLPNKGIIRKMKLIDEKEIIEAFSSDKEINDINQNDTIARSMGINGVPFFEIDNKTYISGAQSTANLIEAIKVNL